MHFSSLTCLPRPAPRASEEGVAISVDLLSSWGNEGEFGLTEIQLFDAKGRWILLKTDGLCVEGTDQETGGHYIISMFDCFGRTPSLEILTPTIRSREAFSY